MKYKKKLIEVSLPLEVINIASAREKSIRHGHPSTLHLWWARRPLAAARAVIFAQMVDDPSEHPDIFKTIESQDKERQRLFGIIKELIEWENTNNEIVLKKAKEEIWQSWRQLCAENAGHSSAKEIFDRHVLPAFHDPFAGGGSIPLEAQRLGLKSYASDLNPVAVLINKALIEIPPMFLSKEPVNPDSQNLKTHMGRRWDGAHGLAEDVRYYGNLINEEAKKKLANYYPDVLITRSMVAERPDLAPYEGKKLTVIAWVWARTVKSPNPAYSDVDVPLTSTFMLSSKPGKEAYIEPLIQNGTYSFRVVKGRPQNLDAVKKGTKHSRANFVCLMSGAPIEGDYIKQQGKDGKMNATLMAVVAEGIRERVYLSPTVDQLKIASSAQPIWRPDLIISGTTQYLGVKPYGMDRFDQIYTNRQLMTLATFSDLIPFAKELIKKDLTRLGLEDEHHVNSSNEGISYSDAIGVYLAFAVDKLAARQTTCCAWEAGYQKIQHTFGRQAIPMIWDFAEGNPFSESTGNFNALLGGVSESIINSPNTTQGFVLQADASVQSISQNKVISTDPPYYDNVPYADLSDFFYVWLRRSLKQIYPNLFNTLAVPKTEELVAFAYRHDGKSGAEKFFLDGMTLAMTKLANQSHPAFPITIYYAFKQTEANPLEGTLNTGWETFLEAVIGAGLAITGTWPMRTELPNRMRGMSSNALASSIVLVCRRQSEKAMIATRREFLAALKEELPKALAHLQMGNIAPVDLAQAAIGPGMAVFTRFSRVLDAEGKELSVRTALSLINQTMDEVLAEQENDFDADSKWALTWFEQYGFEPGEYGVAEQLSKSKVTSVEGLVDGGIVSSKSGKVRLLKPIELKENWDPLLDKRITAWEIVHQLIKTLESDGEAAASKLVLKLGADAEVARELCYRLYTLCERKKRSSEATAYNSLVQSWPEIMRLSRDGLSKSASKKDLFDQE